MVEDVLSELRLVDVFKMNAVGDIVFIVARRVLVLRLGLVELLLERLKVEGRLLLGRFLLLLEVGKVEILDGASDWRSCGRR